MSDDEKIVAIELNEALKTGKAQALADKRVVLEVVFRALAGVIDAWNDLSYEPDERGRSNDLLCIILAEDGSGQVGTVYRVPHEMNPQEGHFKSVDDWVNFFDQWIDTTEWREATAPILPAS